MGRSIGKDWRCSNHREPPLLFSSAQATEPPQPPFSLSLSLSPPRARHPPAPLSLSRLTITRPSSTTNPLRPRAPQSTTTARPSLNDERARTFPRPPRRRTSSFLPSTSPDGERARTSLDLPRRRTSSFLPSTIQPPTPAAALLVESRSGDVTEKSMEFCPTCGTLLLIEPANCGRKMRFFCPTCPYVCPLEGKISRKEPLKKKDIDPIIRWEESMQSLPKGQATCAKCGNNEAYYYQMQIRSADEPMTTFYTCCNEGCKHEWRED